MRLSLKKAKELCIELWTWCMETGKPKEQWPRWKEFGFIDSSCWFCHYNNHTVRGNRRKNAGNCITCPYLKKYGHCNTGNVPFALWDDAKTPRTRKKYAKLFLAQIRKIK